MGRPRALVTGCNGFTGIYLVRQLKAAGYEVVGLAATQTASHATLISANLLDREAVGAAIAAVQPDVVLHLAAVSYVDHGDVDEIYRVNVVGARNLLESLAQLERKPRLVVLASSANVYGNAGIEPISEETSLIPENDYAVSKVAMEYMAKLWVDQLPIVIMRPFNYTGVGQSERFLIAKIVAHFRRGERTIELGNTEVVRDFGDVRDVSRTYMSILDARPVGMTLNLCTGIGHSVDDILDMMVDIAGYRIEVRISSKLVRTHEVRSLVGSRAKLSEEIDLKTPTPLQETLAWMYAS
ncbi:MAG: GDP-mannose 4,6-dehydratase [Rhodanobacter sp.]